MSTEYHLYRVSLTKGISNPQTYGLARFRLPLEPDQLLLGLLDVWPDLDCSMWVAKPVSSGCLVYKRCISLVIVSEKDKSFCAKSPYWLVTDSLQIWKVSRVYLRSTHGQFPYYV